MSENKTKPTRASVAAFLADKAVGPRLADCKALVKLFKEITGQPAKMWGPGIVGFGTYHYVYASGREGDAPLLAFSPRKPAIVLYVAPYPGDAALKKKLGKFKAGEGCLYIRSLADVDLAVLRTLAQASAKAKGERYRGS